MRNVGRCLLGVLAVTLRQPDSTQAIPFKHALACVRALIDFNMMAQYRSHTSDTITYMEDYLDQFHLMPQQKNDLHPVDATPVRTDCVRPMRPVRPDRPPDVFSHPMRLVPPNALIPPPMHPARLLRPPSVPIPLSSFPSSTALI